MGEPRSVAGETASGGELAILVDGGHSVAERQLGELFAPAIEEGIGIDHQRACPQLEHYRERHVQLALAAGAQDMELKTEGACGLAQRYSIATFWPSTYP